MKKNWQVNLPEGALAEKEGSKVFGIGPMELIIVLIIALVIFGPKKLPEMGKALGSGIKEFRNATSSLKDSVTASDNRKEATADKKEAVTEKKEVIPVENEKQV
jgi:sec-independent protein translocase protein TatA